MTTARASTLAGVLGATATAVSASRIVAAIHSIPAPIMNVNVSTTEITKTTTNRDRSGGGTSSGGGGPRERQPI